jgi:hypothetical protein
MKITKEILEKKLTTSTTTKLNEKMNKRIGDYIIYDYINDPPFSYIDMAYILPQDSEMRKNYGVNQYNIIVEGPNTKVTSFDDLDIDDANELDTEDVIKGFAFSHRNYSTLFQHLIKKSDSGWDTASDSDAYYEEEKKAKSIPDNVKQAIVTIWNESNTEEPEIKDTSILDKTSKLSEYLIDNTLVIPEGITTINSINLNILKQTYNLYLPKTLTTIAYGGIDYSRLTENRDVLNIYIPEKVTKMDEYAIVLSSHIKHCNIYCEANSKPSSWNEDWLILYGTRSYTSGNYTHITKPHTVVKFDDLFEYNGDVYIDVIWGAKIQPNTKAESLKSMSVNEALNCLKNNDFSQDLTEEIIYKFPTKNDGNRDRVVDGPTGVYREDNYYITDDEKKQVEEAPTFDGINLLKRIFQKQAWKENAEYTVVVKLPDGTVWNGQNIANLEKQYKIKAVDYTTHNKSFINYDNRVKTKFVIKVIINLINK